MSDTHSNPGSPREHASSNSINNSASTVAEHYNKKSTEVKSDLASRSQSTIFYLRNFNNWIKSVLFNEFVDKLRNDEHNPVGNPSALDLGCGKGGDLNKWRKVNVGHVTFADISDLSLEEAKRRYSEKRHNFTAKFIHLDATRDLLTDHYDAERNDIVQHDLVSSQFVLHYSFESFPQADRFLKNVSDSLKPGGFFIGSTTNGAELVKRLRKAESCTFGNDCYTVKFGEKYKNGEEAVKPELFGVKFDFQLSDVVECPEFLVNFDCLVKMARRHNLTLVLKSSFDEFFHTHSKNNEYRDLITTMQALEPYFPKNKNRNAEESEQFRRAGDYEFIESKINEEDSYIRNEPLNESEAFATLSKSEWEVATLYLVFAFVKDIPEKEATSAANGSEASENRSRHDSETNEGAAEKGENEARESSGRETEQDNEEEEETHSKRKLDDLNSSSEGSENESEPSKKK
jgi:mRNA (guanine-N7-)-methyltransferase